MNLTKNLILLCVSLVCSLLLAEGAVRFFNAIESKPHSTYPTNYFINDDVLGFKLAKNFSGMHAFTDLTYQISTNSMGCPESEIALDTEIDLLILGDSHSWGYVKEKDRYSNQLKDKYGIRTYNCAVTGTSPKYQIEIFKELYNAGMAPDGILLGYLPYNDVEGDILFPEYRTAYGTRYQARKFTTPEYKIIDADPPDYWKYILVSKSALVRLVLEVRRYTLSAEDNDEEATDELPHRLIFHLDRFPDLMNQHVDVLKKFQQELASLDMRLYLYVIPVKPLPGPQKDVYQQQVKNLVAVLESNNLELISAQPYEENAHHKIDGHMNASGHEIIARNIHFYLNK